MHITFISPANLSGGCRVVAIYAKRLIQRGHKVTVIAWERPKPRSFYRRFRRWLRVQFGAKKGVEASHFDNMGVTYRRNHSQQPSDGGDLIPDADVIVATWWATAEWVAELPAQKGAKVYFIQHHEIHQPQSVERVKATYRLPLKKITISHWLVDLMRDSYGDPNTVRVANSVDTQQFYADSRGRQAVPTVGFMYSNKYFKGIDVSLKALEIVRAELPNLRVVMFGEQPPPALQSPPNSDFTAKPAQQQIRNLYAQCDVWLCGSRAEGFHLPPLEAMACRCPVVSTSVGGPLDIIQDGKNGFLVGVEDADGLAKALLKVLRLPEPEWQRLSDAAYATAIGYTWDDATELFEQELQRITNS